jgi:hypothetical protein
MAFRTSSEYNYFVKKNLSAYAGKWVAIQNKNIVADSKQISEVAKRVNKLGLNNVLYAKIPKMNECLIL